MKAIACFSSPGSCLPVSMVLLFLTLGATAQPKYPVSAIAPALLKDAHVVKRLEEISFEMVSLTEAVYKRKCVLTILDEPGQGYADLVVGYDRLRKLSSIEGALYDASGNQLKKVKGKEINDYSNVSDISLYEENRMKVHQFNCRNYPYTVEYEVALLLNNSYDFPDWRPQDFEHLSVEKSSFTFTVPFSYNLRYKAFNYKALPVEVVEKNKKIMKWEVADLTALTRPFASPPWYELTPTVLFAPSAFELEGLKGDASSWLAYGKFQLLLNQNRDKLPPDVLQKIGAITENVSDPKEKVKRLYAFMQAHTRYISIQLGIGGWQPFEASFVAQKGYGDCKALSNYMYSLLKAAGIKSYYTKIRAGETADDQTLIEDFPSNQSNHIVLCVPFVKDTMWLECTDQSVPAGYMGGFTGNRKALIITEEGGKLVSTPRYGVEENLHVRKITGSVNAEGDLSATVNTSYTGIEQDGIYGMLTGLSKERVKKMLNGEFDFSTYEINDFSYATKKDGLPRVDEHLDLSVANCATVSGRRLFITPNLMSRSSRKIFDPGERTCDFVFSYAYRNIDTVEISLPEGYQLEARMPETVMKTAYGNYTASVKLADNKVMYCRKMERFSGRFPAKEGVQIAKFFDDVYKADRGRIVLVKKEEGAKPGM